MNRACGLLLVFASLLAGCARAWSGSATATVLNSPAPAPVIIVLTPSSATPTQRTETPTTPMSVPASGEPSPAQQQGESGPRYHETPAPRTEVASGPGSWEALRAVCESGGGAIALSQVYAWHSITATGTVTKLGQDDYGFMTPDADTLRCDNDAFSESAVGARVTVSGTVSEESGCGEAAVRLRLINCTAEARE